MFELKQGEKGGIHSWNSTLTVEMCGDQQRLHRITESKCCEKRLYSLLSLILGYCE